jgi:signal transduction histidine kinase
MREMPTEPDPPVPGTRKIPIHRQLLGSGLYLHTIVRLLVALGIVGGSLIARHIVGIENLDVGMLVALGVAIMAYDAATFALVRPYRERQDSPEVLVRLTLIMHVSIVLDFLALTVAIWLVGGVRSPFLVFYVLHVILAWVNLSRRAAFLFSGLAFVLIAALAAGDWFAFLPPRMPAGALLATGPLDGRYAATVLVVFAVLLGLLSFFLSGIISQLRQAESRIRLANAELYRLSNIRRDFLHIAVHNIRSPMGAVTMFLRNMLDGLGGPVTDRQREWIDRSLARIDGLMVFLTDMKALSDLEVGLIKAEFHQVEVAPLLESLVEEHRDLAGERKHELVLDLPQALPPVLAHERLLREAVVNYLTNAIRYTPEGGRIVVRALHAPPIVRIEVEDNGIGIALEDQPRLFKEFVRLDRRGTPVAKVEGSGLGLSIVRRIAEAFGGAVFVRSRPGAGSTFAIDLPQSTV